MSSDLQERIQHASSRNAELLSGLQETDSAPSQLYQQIQYINDLEAQLERTETRVASLKKKTESELKDHKKYSESTFRRFAHKASGQKEKFAEKAAKEEHEYFDAIQEQKTAEDELSYVKQLKAEAEVTRTRFEIEVQRHDQLQQDLDSLYASIFNGPTPGFPEEDEREAACTAANKRIQDIHRNFEKERHVLFLLRQVAAKLDDARRHLFDAHSLSQMDLIGGGAMTSMRKRNYLERAESSVSQVRMLQSQIRRIKPGMADLGPMDIASGSILWDVFFDNFFSDMQMHDKIKKGWEQIVSARERCGALVRAQEEREKRGLGDLKGAEARLRRARGELQRARMEAFGRVDRGERIEVGASVNVRNRASPPPPSYTDAPPAYSA